MKAIQLHRDLTRIWEGEPGWRGVLTSVSHTDLGKRFIIAAAVFFGIGGVLAMLIRAQLATPESAFAGPEVYGQIFTMHGSIMMFLFAIPMLEGLAIYLLPKILGARDLAEATQLLLRFPIREDKVALQLAIVMQVQRKAVDAECCIGGALAQIVEVFFARSDLGTAPRLRARSLVAHAARAALALGFR